VSGCGWGGRLDTCCVEEVKGKGCSNTVSYRQDGGSNLDSDYELWKALSAKKPPKGVKDNVSRLSIR